MSEQIKSKEIPLTKMLREELNHITGQCLPVSDDEKLEDVFKDFHKEKLSALCFSGGGIRSATFGLGIVQALAERGLLDKFDYLSTVSGGGYLGAWLSAWIRREQTGKFEEAEKKRISELKNRLKELRENAAKENDAAIERLKDEIAESDERLFARYGKSEAVGIEEVQRKLKAHSIKTSDADEPPCPNPEPKQLQHLREYSNYMSPKVGLLSADTWTLIGIYVRNLFLNWTIFIPLICAILLVPRILLAFTEYKADNRGLLVMLLIGLIAGTAAIVCTVRKLPSKNIDGGTVECNTDGGVFATVIAPLIITALAATTFWAWVNRTGQPLFNTFDELPILKHRVINFILFSVVIFVLGNASFFIARTIFYIYEKYKSGRRNLRDIAASLFSFAVLLEIVSAGFSAVVGGLLTWLIANNFFTPEWLNADDHRRLYVCFAAPLYLLSFSTGATVFVGVYSKFASDDDREWLARQGAWVLIVCGAWILLNGLVLFGTQGFDWLIEQTGKLISHGGGDFIEYVKTSIVPIIVAVSGFISLVGGFSGKSVIRDDEPNNSKLSKFLSIAPKIAAVVFLGFIFIALTYVSELLLSEINVFLHRFLENRTDWMAIIKYLNVLPATDIDYRIFWLVALAVVGIAMACVINVNKFSLHAAYRDRLIRAYLGASHINRKGNAFTGFDDADNFQLHRLKGQKPFHIINATLNLVAGKNLAWQNRKAASFTMSPLHCGSWLLGYRNSNEYCRNKKLPPCKDLRYCNRRGEKCPSIKECDLPGKALRLGTAMTISGAAANPNMGYYSSPVVTFLMTLFNIRLGWWLGNTGAKGDDLDWGGYGRNEFYTKPSPSIAVLPLINETLGLTNQDKHFLNVTDGGHFENLGLYEMILRRCHTIVLSDAAADDSFTFGEIANAVEKCKVDLGVNIKFKDDIHIYSRHQKLDDEMPKKRYAVAEIIYPEKDENGKNIKGNLLYIRPSFYEKLESTELRYYARSNSTFPHQSTADQLYDEKQFEAYRALGFCIMEEILERKSAKTVLRPLTDKIDVQKPVGEINSPQTLPELLGSESSDAV